jgi:hypothetical protein
MKLNSKGGFVFTTSAAVTAGLVASTALTAGATATAIGAGITGLAAYGAYKAVTGLAGGGSKASSQQQATPQAPSYDRAAALAQQDADTKRRGIARNKATYTSAQGLTPTDQSNLNLKTLTGV